MLNYSVRGAVSLGGSCGGAAGIGLWELCPYPHFKVKLIDGVSWTRSELALATILFVVFMDRILRGSQVEEGVWCRNIIVASSQILFCWSFQAMTSSTHWSGLQLSVKRPE